MATQLKDWYDCRNKCVFSFWRNVVSDGADWTSAGRLFQSPGPAAAKERSPTVTSLDGRTSRRLEVDDRSRPRRLVGRSATYDVGILCVLMCKTYVFVEEQTLFIASLSDASRQKSLCPPYALNCFPHIYPLKTTSTAVFLLSHT